MPTVPDAAVQAAMAAVFAHDDPDGMTAEELTRVILEAAAPVLAEHAARAITAHMEEHSAVMPETMARRYRRHLGIAARVAAGAFSTREDQLKQAAEAIARGDFIACDAERTVPGGDD